MKPDSSGRIDERHEAAEATTGCGCGGACGGDRADEGPGTSRRDFLKVIGVGGAGAATVACGPPDFADKLIPNLVQEEGIVPGVNETYATVLPDAGPEPLAVHATVRDGRVLKLEPNDRLGGGNGLTALAQSALQDLYDPDRIPGPQRAAGDGTFAAATWEEADGALAAAIGGGGTVLLTGAVTGTTRRFFSEWAAAVGAQHIAWEPLGNEAFSAALTDAGSGGLPRYDLGAADRIVCFGADFLGTWLSPTDLSAGFAASRDIDGTGHRHAKFTYVGARLGLTGSNADEWLEARSGTEGQVAMAVANVIAAARGATPPAGAGGYTPESVADATGVSAERIRALADELMAASSPLAIPPGVESQGADAAAAHRAVVFLNQTLGAVGRTIEPGAGPVNGTNASFAEMRALIGRMTGGQVRTLVVSGCNPVFALPASAGFAEALGSVQNVISLSPHMDETAAAAAWILPSNHALESWGDAELTGGAIALAQPVMAPIFSTRQREDTLLIAAGAAGGALGAPDYATYLRNAWLARMGGGENQWLDALRHGGVAGLPPASAADAGGAASATGGARAGAAAAAPAAAATTGGAIAFTQGAGSGTHLVVYPTVQYYDGRGANRSWMQELPDPITKAVWTTWVEMHPDMAASLGVRRGDVVRVESPAGAIEAPAYLYEGIRADTVAIPLGQGHTAYGRSAAGRGANPLDLLAPNADPGSGALAFAGTTVTVTATGERGRLVITQGSHDDLGREIADIINVDDALHEIEEHEVDLVAMVEAAHDSDPASPYRWGMVIDLNACTGCGACVTACHAENNIPTVGEALVAQRREMSWMRVHTFHERTEEGGFQTVHQPMLCQHCGDAPCEPVCPVYATYHSPEGLNVQVYNRCVGTRYCSNNCPYKVRRFNWFTYEFPYPLNLQLNPDVTVREKGVMDKCTFCVQRINSAKLDAKDEGRLVE
ncbi:MAG: molybdopterin dinucleotide binding domain-containing protein, partial [Gemmatimonadota bacterium]|nr:molybdopterin dinucleotide binding domain-containing protein [Gemmatimonadota bacterium]